DGGLRLVRADLLTQDGPPDRHPRVAVDAWHLATVDRLRDGVERELSSVLLREERQVGRTRPHEARGDAVALSFRSMARPTIANVELLPGRLRLGGRRQRDRAEHDEHDRPEYPTERPTVPHRHLPRRL